MKYIIVGGQYGDEGKGKIISYLALKDNFEVITRAGVGPNAGHKIIWKGTEYGLRMVPCGFVNENARLLIGAGVLISPERFFFEAELTNSKKRIGIDYRATVILPKHLECDKNENSKKIGTTGKGCGPAIADRVNRTAVLVSEIPELKPFLTDVAKEVNEAKNVLIEGSQGFMLSLLYGTYPFVTSKDTTASTVAADVGLGPKAIDEVIMVIKSYTTRVGNGPFKSEISTEEAVKLNYQEYGTVTGRPRRISKDLHFDDLRLAAKINSATQIAITKIDIKFPGNANVRKFKNLTPDAQDFIKLVEKEISVPVTLIGTGPNVEDIIDLRYS
ncbi:MAG: adenylosuccinate synthetase [Candidatus Micrarchaeota archaeon]